MHAIIRRLRAFLRRDRLDDELAEEISTHIELRRRTLIEQGWPATEADVEARRAFGNVTNVREQLHDGWGFPRLDSLLQDVRYGARLWRRAPGFTAVAILSLSVGLGAAAVVFNVADAVLFRPLSVRDPGSLRDFRAAIGSGGGPRKQVLGAGPAEIEAMRSSADFADLIAFRTLDDVALTISSGDAAGMVRTELVSAGYFSVLGVVPAAGRLLDGTDRGSSPVPVVISERLWRSRLAGDPAAVGRTAAVNGASAIIVGIARDFRGLMVEQPADVFAPLASTFAIEPVADNTMARLVMRLRAGVPQVMAEEKMAAIYRGLGPPMARAGELRVTLGDASRGVSDAREELRWPIGLGLILVGVLMVVACANTGGLLVARFAARRTEFGVRMAIGAGHSRLMRQLIVEAMLLAMLAGGVALAIAAIAAPLLGAAVPAGSTPVAFEVRFDWRLIAFTMLASAAAAAGAGAMSLRQLMRTDTSAALNAASRSVVHGRRAAMDVLIASQVGCSLVLLIVTGAMGRTLVNLRQVDPGFSPGAAVAITVNASARPMTSEALPPYFAALLDRVTALPQVASATVTQMGLLTRGMTTGSINVPGWSPASDDERFVRLFFVGPNFFETAGMRLVAGDGFGPADRSKTVVVTQQFARFYFGSPQAAIGHFVNRDLRIVGVVADARYNTLRDEPVRAMFVPFTQAPPRSTMTFIVRPAGDQRQAVEAATAAIRGHDPLLKVTTATMASLVEATMGRERFAAAVAAALAVLALILSCAGVYATVAFAVSERRRELAVRFALGATRRDVERLVLRGPLRVALFGIAAAVPCAYALMRAISTLLFDVPAFDAWMVAACGLGLLLVAALAAAVPAWRATSIDPQECLRSN
jgi:putative ABC transport system permease protein